MTNISKNANSGVKWNSIATAVNAFSSLLKVSVLTRYLEKDDFGLMAIIMFVLGLVMLFMDMGLTSAILHRENVSKKEFSSLFWLNAVFSSVLYALLFFSSPWVANFYDESELAILIPLAGLSILIAAIGRQFKTLEYKNLNFKKVAIIEISASIFSLVIGIVLAINDFGVYSLVYSAIAQFLLSNVLLFIHGISHHGLLLHYNYEETKPFLKIGAFQVGGQVINYFNKDLDILIIGKFFGADILGGYSLAKQLVLRPSRFINPVITKVASPVLSKFQNDKEKLKKNYLHLLNVVSTINIPIYLIIAIFAPFFVKILYGSDFLSIVNIVRILSFYMVFRAIGNPIGSLVVATGRTDREFVWNFVLLLIMPLFIFIGAQFSIIHVSLSLLLSMIILFVPSWLYLVKPLANVELKEYVKNIIPNFKILIPLIRKVIKS